MYTVIFGCGNLGMETLGFIGSERVDYFCDNNAGFAENLLGGKKVLDYAGLLELIKNSEVLIILGVNRYNAEIIARQLESDAIYDFVVARLLPGFGSGKGISDEVYEKIRNKSTRYEFVNRHLRERYAIEKRQVDYLKRHADIRRMSPATGKLRQIQLDSVAGAQAALSFLKENCPVKCWITSGTLIGMIRHNGFIPWDDDIDFGIMREDVYRLMDFFRTYSTVIIYGKCQEGTGKGRAAISRYDTLREAMDACKDRYFIGIHPDYIRVYTCEKDRIKIALELFPFDYYRQNLSIGDYHKYVSDGFMMKKKLPSDKDWFNYLYDKIENGGIVSSTPTDKILPGMDSFIYRGLWNIEDFLPQDAVFPLKEVEFEGEKYWCVNDEERYLEHEYPDWRNFPGYVGVDEELEE